MRLACRAAIHTADGATHTIDTLVCATGFHTSAPPPFPVIGSNGRALTEQWETRATSYLSHSISSFPNLFTMLGPNGSMTVRDEPLRRRVDVQTYVQMVGGDYFFLPSMPALRYLATL